MAYIGNSPGTASQRIVSSFTATASQTTFVPSSGYALGYCDVFLNGVKLIVGDDYTASDGVSVVLASGASAGDSIEVVSYIPRGLSDGYTKSEADAKYLPLTGGSVSGNLTLSGGTANGVLYLNGSKVATSGSALTFDGTNLGLGVAPSAWAILKGFEVGRVGNAIAGHSSAPISYISAAAYFNDTGTTSWKYATTGDAVGLYEVGQAHKWYTAASGTAGNAITFKETMKLSASGQLEVFASSGNGGRVDIYSNNATTNQITLAQGFALATDNIGYLYNRANEAFVFGTNNAERARITSGGDLLVGTTTTDNKLTVSSSSSGAAAGVLSLVNPNDATSTAADLDFVTHSNGTLATGRIRGLVGGSNNYPISFWTYNSSGLNERLRITSAGALQITQSAGTYTLDTTSSSATYANNATVDFANFSGMIIANDQFNTGYVTIWLVGGGVTSAVSSVGGTVGSMAYEGSVNGYRWTNNSGQTRDIAFMAFRTRNTA